MTIDYSALLYDPVYAELGVPATLTVADTDGAEVEITVIDQTRQKVQMAGSAEVSSVGPRAFARVPELTAKGIIVTDKQNNNYRGAMLAFNGRTWIIRSAKTQGSPNGEEFGEVLFELQADQ